MYRQVSLELAMGELGIELEVLERQEPGIKHLQEIRLGLVTGCAAMEAQCVGRVYSILERSEDLSRLESIEIGKLLNDSETTRRKLESTSDEVTILIQTKRYTGTLLAGQNLSRSRSETLRQHLVHVTEAGYANCREVYREGSFKRSPEQCFR